jgi:hypothetical protein
MLPTKFRFIWLHGFIREYFLEINQSETRILWRPCFLTDRDEMSNIYRAPSIDASYQVSVHLAKRFQRRRFLEINQSETRIVCGSHVC